VTVDLSQEIPVDASQSKKRKNKPKKNKKKSNEELKDSKEASNVGDSKAKTEEPEKVILC
jgi:hypothetical protein